MFLQKQQESSGNPPNASAKHPITPDVIISKNTSHSSDYSAPWSDLLKKKQENNPNEEKELNEMLQQVKGGVHRDLSTYLRENCIGEGTYGRVYKGIDKLTNEEVALKKMKIPHDEKTKRLGMPATSLREINVLRKLFVENNSTKYQPNIIQLKDIVVDPKKTRNTYLVFEFCAYDLSKLMNHSRTKIKKPERAQKKGYLIDEDVLNKQNCFDLQEAKGIMLQLLSALNFLHKNHIIHRDLKMANLLVSKDGNLKLADFGLARFMTPQQNSAESSSINLEDIEDETSKPKIAQSPQSQTSTGSTYDLQNPNMDILYRKQKLTPDLVTLWYRSPEVLFGSRDYDFAADMWSAGCIFAELLINRALLPGPATLEQTKLTVRMLGIPNEKDWPGFMKFRNVAEFLKQDPSIFKEEAYISEQQKIFGVGIAPIGKPANEFLPDMERLFKNKLSNAGFDFLTKLLCYNPANRMTAEQAMQHRFFSEIPLPARPEQILSSIKKKNPSYDAVQEEEKKRKFTEGPGKGISDEKSPKKKKLS